MEEIQRQGFESRSFDNESAHYQDRLIVSGWGGVGWHGPEIARFIDVKKMQNPPASNYGHPKVAIGFAALTEQPAC